MDSAKIENAASKLKAVGGSIVALGGTVAAVQTLTNGNPKAAMICAAAGLVIHGASTACNELADLLVAIVGIFAPKPPAPPAQ